MRASTKKHEARDYDEETFLEISRSTTCDSDGRKLRSEISLHESLFLLLFLAWKHSKHPRISIDFPASQHITHFAHKGEYYSFLSLSLTYSLLIPESFMLLLYRYLMIIKYVTMKEAKTPVILLGWKRSEPLERFQGKLRECLERKKRI